MRTAMQGNPAWVLLAALFCMGCKVGPNYATPATCVNSNWSMDQHPRLQGEPANLETWWEHFNDPTLVQLICCVREQNLTLKETGQRVLEARARRNVAYGNLFPQFQQAGGAYSKSKLSTNTANFFSFPSVFEPNIHPANWQVGLNAAWELDFWGRYRRIIEAADATVEETQASYDAATVLLLAEVAVAYVELRTLESRIGIAKRNLEIQSRTLKMAQDKREAGLSTTLDVAQATSIFGQTESTLPLLETSRLQTSHRIAALLGRNPTDISSEIQTTSQIPEPPIGLAFGVPADLIRRRPDVRKAERALAAQSAKIGVAEAEFYPHISLVGSVGYSAQDFNNLFRSRSSVGIISPQFGWNILNYNRLRNNVEAEKAAFMSLAFAYQQSVIEAEREAEDAQVAYVLGFDRLRSLATAVQGAATAVEKAEILFREGAIDYGRVYLLQAELLRQQDAMVETQGNIASYLVSFFKALGGGWQNECCGVTESAGSLATLPESTPLSNEFLLDEHSARSAPQVRQVQPPAQGHRQALAPPIYMQR